MANAFAFLGSQTSHGGSITSGASKYRCGSSPIARIGDTHSCPIHGPNPIIGPVGGKRPKIEGQFVAYVGDVSACGAEITTGCDKMFGG